MIAALCWLGGIWLVLSLIVSIGVAIAWKDVDREEHW